jgi:hypothetical protein
MLVLFLEVNLLQEYQKLFLKDNVIKFFLLQIVIHYRIVTYVNKKLTTLVLYVLDVKKTSNMIVVVKNV